MPDLTSPDIQSKIIAAHGLDPAQWEITPDGTGMQLKSAVQSSSATQEDHIVTDKDFEDTPQVQVTPLAKRAVSSPLETGIRTTIDQAPSVAGGGVGVASALALAIGAGLDMTGAGALLGIPIGLVGAYLGSKAVRGAQDTLTSDQYKQSLAAAQQENPNATTAGEIAAMPLGGFNPSPTGVLRAGGTLGKLVAGLARSPEEMANLANVGIGAGLARSPEEMANLANVGIGAGIGAVQPLVEGQTDPEEILKSAAEGALFNKPNLIGQRLGFSHGERLMADPKKVRDMFMAQQNVPDQQTVNDGNKTVNVTPSNLSAPVPDVTSTVNGININKAALNTGKVPAIDPDTGEIATTPAGRAKMRSVGEIPAVIDKELGTQPSELTSMVAEGGQDPEVLAQQKAEATLRQLVANAPRLPEGDSRQIPADVAGGEMPPTQKFQKNEQLLTPAGKILLEHSKELGLDVGRITPEYFNNFAEQISALHGIRDLPVDRPNGPRGTSYFTPKGQSLGVSTINVPKTEESAAIPNRSIAGAETQPHELGHHIWSTLTPEERLVRQNADQANFDAYNKQRVENGLPANNFEEYYAAKMGQGTVDRLIDGSGEQTKTPLKNWWNDTKALFAEKYGKNPTVNELDRADIYKLVNGISKLNGTIGANAGAVIGKNQDDEQPLHQGGANAEYWHVKKVALQKEYDQHSAAMQQHEFGSPEHTAAWTERERVKNQLGGHIPDAKEAAGWFQKMHEAVQKNQPDREGLFNFRQKRQEGKFVPIEKALEKAERERARRAAHKEEHAAIIGDTAQRRHVIEDQSINREGRPLHTTLADRKPLGRELTGDTKDAEGNVTKEGELTQTRRISNYVMNKIYNRSGYKGNQMPRWTEDVRKQVWADVVSDLQKYGLDSDGLMASAARRTYKYVQERIAASKLNIKTTSLDRPVGENGTQTGYDKVAAHQQELPDTQELGMQGLKSEEPATQEEEHPLQEEAVGTKKEETPFELSEEDKKTLRSLERTGQLEKPIEDTEKVIGEPLKPTKRKASIEKVNKEVGSKLADEWLWNFSDRYDAMHEKMESAVEEADNIADAAKIRQRFAPELARVKAVIDALENKRGTVVGPKEIAELVGSQTKHQGAKEGITPEQRFNFLKIMPALDKARRAAGPEGKPVADALQKLPTLRDEFYGKYSNKPLTLASKMPEADVQKVHNLLMKEDLNQTSYKHLLTNQKQKELYEATRQSFEQKQKDQIAAGQQVRDFDAKGKSFLRDAKINPFYYPSILRPDVIDAILERKGDYKRYQNLLLEHWGGKNSEVAQQKLEALKMSGDARQPNATRFGANRLTEGVGLPEELRVKDFSKTISKYYNKVATDRAWHDLVEKNPVVSHLLDPKNTDGVAHEFNGIVSDIKGEPFDKNAGLLSSVNRVFTSALLGPMTNIHIGWSTIFNPFQYIKGSELATVYPKALANWGEAAEKIYQNGYKRRDLNTLKDITDSQNTFIQKMQAVSSLIGKVNGRDFTDRVSKTFAQAFGEQVVPLRIEGARQGDRWSQKLMMQLDPNWTKEKVYSKEEISSMSSTLGGLIHGAHDYRTLPELMTKESWAQPFLSLQSWSVSQTNQWMKHVWEPAMEGNFQPLMMSTLGAAVGGYVIQQLRQTMMDKKSAIPSFTEILNSRRGASGNAGLLAYNFMQMASFTGFMGIGSSLAKIGFDEAYKNIPQSMTFPLDEGVSSISKHISDAYSAWAQRPTVDNFMQIFPQAMIDLAKENVQTARIADNWLSDAGASTANENYRYKLNNAEADLRRYKMVEGQPYDQQTETANNPYLNMEQKSFKRTSDVREAAHEVPSLIQLALTRAQGNPEIFKSQLAALKQNSYQTMPSPENLPIQFGRYYQYLVKLYGPEVAQERMKDYTKQNAINKVKEGMIPSHQ